VFSTLCIKTSSFGKIDSIVNDNGVMASNGDFIYGRVASRETAVEAVMNQSCFLVHFVVRARSFPKINTFLVLGSLDSVEKRNAPTTKWGKGRKGFVHVFFHGPSKLSVSVGLVDFSFYNFEIHLTSLSFLLFAASSWCFSSSSRTNRHASFHSSITSRSMLSF
jgi:hypothetical protein